MTDVKDLYYSNFCPYSCQIAQFVKQKFNDSITVINVDDYYFKYDDIPPRIRGTPTILTENTNGQIRAYEGEDVEKYIRSLLTRPTQLPQTQIPIGGFAQNPSMSMNPPTSMSMSQPTSVSMSQPVATPQIASMPQSHDKKTSKSNLMNAFSIPKDISTWNIGNSNTYTPPTEQPFRQEQMKVSGQNQGQERDPGFSVKIEKGNNNGDLDQKLAEIEAARKNIFR